MKPLTKFPEDFQPLVVITGDRREIPPHSKGDLLAYSVSNTDFMYMNHLRLGNSLTLSDKQFVIDTEEVLRQQFGAKNILVIGSPAVNLLARRINDYSIFRFAISEETKTDLEEQNEFIEKFVHDEDDLFIYQQCLDGIVEIDSIIARFLGLEPNIEALRERAKYIVPEFTKMRICRDLKTHRRPIRFLMHQLDKPGIFDSLARTIRGEAIPAYKDYGLISVVKNPFSESDDYHIIYVAGVHGPGTALGVKMLADKNAFTQHPFGGVYEVKIDRFASFFEKFQTSRPRWETPPYDQNRLTPEDFLNSNKIKVFLSSPGGKTDHKQKGFNEKFKLLLKETCENMGFELEIEGPYTLAMGGKIDFWQAILDYEKDCKFIIHDMTDCARGVMVEIGFSIGRRKQYFLVWNMEKSPVKEWSEMRIPSLLPTANIDEVKLSELTTTKKVVKKKIIEKARQNMNTPNCPHCHDLPKRNDRKSAFIYAYDKELERYLSQQLADREIYRIVEEDSKRDSRICQICQSLRVSDYAFVEISDKDLNSFIVLGMAKAIDRRTLPISLDKYSKKSFPWAKDAVSYQIGNIEEQLKIPVAKFLYD